MSRLPDPTPHLEGKDLLLYQELCAKRGQIDGMYRTLLNHPELTKHVSDLGTYLRFESTLEGKFREFIILSLAHELKVDYEWMKHLQPAIQAGLSQEIIASLKSNSPLPEPYHTLSLGIKYPLNLENIPDQLQDKIVQIISIKGLLELVILVGFYRMIAGVITAFDVPLPSHSHLE